MLFDTVQYHPIASNTGWQAGKQPSRPAAHFWSLRICCGRKLRSKNRLFGEYWNPIFKTFTSRKNRQPQQVQMSGLLLRSRGIWSWHWFAHVGLDCLDYAFSICFNSGLLGSWWGGTWWLDGWPIKLVPQNTNNNIRTTINLTNRLITRLNP